MGWIVLGTLVLVVWIAVECQPTDDVDSVARRLMAGTGGWTGDRKFDEAVASRIGEIGRRGQQGK